MQSNLQDPTGSEISTSEAPGTEFELGDAVVIDQTAAETTETDPTGGGLTSPGEVAAPEESNGGGIKLSPARGTTPEAAVPGVIPRIPIPIPRPILRAVRGRYRSPAVGFQLELRVDVDGVRPMKRVSGDFFLVSGGTTTYFGSFVVSSPVITTTSASVTIKGLGSYTWSAGAPVVQVTIPRRMVIQPAAPATVQFFTTAGSRGASYICEFQSVYFRSVRIETDRVSDVTTPTFTSYNTGSLPSGGAARNLSVVSAYAEAGIEMTPTTGSDVINIIEAGAGATWSDSELHASMVKHFSLWRDIPQWCVWQVVCQLHELGSGLYGIMFDQQGKQRQGCAVFHAGIGGTTADKLRLQLYTYVHELGHCFNLLHSWQKAYAKPPGTNRPAALSWMNYPWYYPGGAAAFWSAFPFQFDDPEVIHLRHAFRNNIIMGGNDFGIGSALERTEQLATPITDDSGLKLEIGVSPRLACGEPVVLKLRLSTTDTRGKTAHPHLHPNFGLVQVAIRKPSGQIVAYEPFIEHCVIPQRERLEVDQVFEESAYIGFGKDGHYFDQPGRYQVRAIYAALDGSQVASNILPVWVSYPVTEADEKLAELFLGDEQGILLSLLGSDSDSLKQGNEAFDEVLAKHPKHRLAAYARLVKGVNAARQFKTITEEKESRLAVRAPRARESVQHLSAAIGAGVLDPLSAEMASVYLADSHATLGDMKAAAEVRPPESPKAARGICAKRVTRS